MVISSKLRAAVSLEDQQLAYVERLAAMNRPLRYDEAFRLKALLRRSPLVRHRVDTEGTEEGQDDRDGLTGGAVGGDEGGDGDGGSRQYSDDSLRVITHGVTSREGNSMQIICQSKADALHLVHTVRMWVAHQPPRPSTDHTSTIALIDKFEEIRTLLYGIYERGADSD